MTIHLIIKGKVQGVFFRASAKEMADSLGIRGWVKNAPDGNVEILATGNEDTLNRFISWCRKGPPRAVVSQVDVSKKEETGFDNFQIKKSTE
jgi:acylphosphatase